jgi:hypothetical protein
MFSSYTELETSYGRGEVHALDIKKTCGESLVEIFAPVREYIR